MSIVNSTRNLTPITAARLGELKKVATAMLVHEANLLPLLVVAVVEVSIPFYGRIVKQEQSIL